MNPHMRVNAAQLKLLNMAIGKLKLDREDIKARFGVASTRELTVAQFEAAMTHFAACGFEYRPKVELAPRIAAPQRIKQVYLVAIQTILGTLGRPWAYAEGIGWQMFKVGKLEWLKPWQLHKVQIALIYEANPEARERRKGRQAGTPAPLGTAAPQEGGA
jgi:phage gp16-like protein